MPLMDDAPAHSATHQGFWIQDFTPVLEGKNKNTKTCNLYGIHQRQPTKVDADVGQKEAALCVSLGALSREFCVLSSGFQSSPSSEFWVIEGHNLHSLCPSLSRHYIALSFWRALWLPDINKRQKHPDVWVSRVQSALSVSVSLLFFFFGLRVLSSGSPAREKRVPFGGVLHSFLRPRSCQRRRQLDKCVSMRGPVPRPQSPVLRPLLLFSSWMYSAHLCSFLLSAHLLSSANWCACAEPK